MQKSKNPYFTSLPFQLHCLNLSANMGISAIMSQQLRQMRSRNAGTTALEFSHDGGKSTMRAAQKRALAGVGRPMNDEVCRLSILNLANRNAEKTTKKKAR